jgi:starch synthase (maltosyl-transferring)
VSKKSGRPQVVDQARQRVWIEKVSPEIDCGRFAVKRVIGDEIVVEVDLVADGHDEVGGVLFVWHEADSNEREIRLAPLGNDRYRATFVAERLGRYLFRVAGFIDELATFRKGFAKKVEAALDVSVETEIGRRIVARLFERSKGADRAALERVLAKLAPSSSIPERKLALLDPELAEIAARHPDLDRASWLDKPRSIVVDPPIARFSAWYEMFPRSCGPEGAHGTFADAEARLPYVESLGFDVLYLPPIHPIGRTHRKGKNNTLTAGPGDVGSPWAIGAEEGGHTAIHPQLGTLEDFRHFVGAARAHGLEVALDIAFQASPDHPWVAAHPEWFVKRPDGTIQYAENPPKKYQDIYPLDFESADAMGLWLELRSVFEFWIESGVRIFRVDNPHTKAFAFWEWCIGELKREHPDLVFLAEAFTKPKVMYALAKLGFTQSYTYFTWRYTPHDFIEYLTELTKTEAKEFFRPNFWPNTPDILPPHLTEGGRPAFSARLVLAATLSSNYGIYGPAFELMERTPRPGAEEYVDNEKYELKRWDLDREDSLRHLIARINRIRREHPALHSNDSLVFHPADDPFLCYSKRAGDDVTLMVVSFDPFHKRGGFVSLDLGALGLSPSDTFEVHDLVGDSRYHWQGSRNYVELDPHAMPAHVFSVKKVP